MGFITPGRDSHLRINGLRLRDCPAKAPRFSCRSSSFSSALKRARHHNSRTPTPPHTTTTSTARSLSRFESLPPEILHSVFTHCHNLHLAQASAHLARTLAARNLQLSYVHAHRTDPDALSRVFTLRFFTAPFLTLLERHFACALDCTGACVSRRVGAAPWTKDTMRLLSGLVARRARLEPAEEWLWVLHEAVVARRGDVVAFLVQTAGLRPDVESLRLAVRHTVGEEGELGVCRILAESGAQAADVRVWREALALGRGSGAAKTMGWLLEEAAPPGEVLGELILSLR